MSEPIKINVLLCDTFPGRLPDDIPSYVSLHEELFRRVAPDVRFRVYMTMDGELPQSLNGDELYLVPGCICSAYDPFPWIENLQSWIRGAVAHHAFLVGICFGTVNTIIEYNVEVLDTVNNTTRTVTVQGYGSPAQPGRAMDDANGSFLPIAS